VLQVFCITTPIIVAEIILASASPRRLELLKQIGIHPIVHPARINETRLDESPDEYTKRIALEKAQKIAADLADDMMIVLGADTTVVLDKTTLGKPQNEADASAMLNLISGRTHRVLSAVVIVRGSRQAVRLSETEVRFRALDATEIAAYWQTGEPRDKAGGYAIQGLGATFIEAIKGSYSGVMGLPLFETAQLLKEFGYDK